MCLPTLLEQRVVGTGVTMNQQAVLDDDQAVLGLFDKYCEL